MNKTDYYIEKALKKALTGMKPGQKGWQKRLYYRYGRFRFVHLVQGKWKAITEWLPKDHTSATP